MDPNQPEIIMPHPAQRGDFLPDFPTVAGALDRFARRVPWWAWLIGGIVIGKGVFSTITGGVAGMAKRALGWAA
jgi:hypothetical protein